MKAFYLILICGLIIQCTSPEKQNETIAQTDTTSSPADSTASTSSLETQQPSVTAVAPDTSSGFNDLNYESFFVLENYAPETSIPANDLEVITKPSAVIVSPSEEQMKDIEKKAGEDFATVMDDAMYYQGMAIEMLDSIDVETVMLEKRFVRFKSSNGKTWELDIRKEGAPGWNMIFFKPGKEPEIVSSVELTHERINNYFK